MKSLQLEMRLERIEAAVRVRDQADPDTRRVSALQHGRHIVVQLEVLVRRPLRVDLARAGIDGFGVRRLPPICSMMCRVYATKISASYGASSGSSRIDAALATAASNAAGSTSMRCRAQNAW